jgi:hypothetical protein
LDDLAVSLSILRKGHSRCETTPRSIGDNDAKGFSQQFSCLKILNGCIPRGAIRNNDGSLLARFDE